MKRDGLYGLIVHHPLWGTIHGFGPAFKAAFIRGLPRKPVFPPNRILREGEECNPCVQCGSGKHAHREGGERADHRFVRDGQEPRDYIAALLPDSGRPETRRVLWEFYTASPDAILDDCDAYELLLQAEIVVMPRAQLAAALYGHGLSAKYLHVGVLPAWAQRLDPAIVCNADGGLCPECPILTERIRAITWPRSRIVPKKEGQ